MASPVKSVLKTLGNFDVDLINLLQNIHERAIKNLGSNFSSLIDDFSLLKALLETIKSNDNESNVERAVPEKLLQSILHSLCLPVLQKCEKAQEENSNEELVCLACDIVVECLTELGVQDFQKILNVCCVSLDEYVICLKYGLEVGMDNNREDVQALIDSNCALMILTNIIKCNNVNNLDQFEIVETLPKIVGKVKEILLCCNEHFGARILNLFVSELMRGADDEKRLTLLQLLTEVSFSYFSFDYCDCSSKRTNLGFLILSYAWDHMRLFLNSEFMKGLCYSSQLWHIIQQGMVHEDPLNRKRALYFFQQLIQSLEDGQISYPVNGKIFSWKKSQNDSRLWSEFFLIIESLEERQVHVIKPVLPRVAELIEMAIDIRPHENPDYCIVHPSWIFIVYQRMFKHESKYIREWGVSHFLSLKISKKNIMEDELDKFTFYPVLDALNDPVLFACPDDSMRGNCPAVATLLTTFLKNVSLALEDATDQKIFLNDFLKHLTYRTWNTVSLLYIGHALASLPEMPVWDSNALLLLRDFLCNALKTQDVYLRAAVQYFFLQALLKLTCIHNISYLALADVLSVFQSDECLQRKSKLWSQVVEWLMKTIKKLYEMEEMYSISKENAVAFCKKIVKDCTEVNDVEGNVNYQCIETKKVSRLVILLLDAKVLRTDDNISFSFAEIFLPFHRLLLSINTRLYVRENNIISCLKFLKGLLEEMNSVSDTDIVDDDVQRYLLTWLEPLAKEVFIYVIKKLPHSIQTVEDCDCLDLYVAILQKFSDRFTHKTFLHLHFSDVIDSCCSVICSGKECKNFSEFSMPKYAAAKCLAWMCECLRLDNLKILLTDVNMKIMKCIENEIIPKYLSSSLNTLEVKSSNRFHQNQWGRMASDYICCMWQCLDYYLSCSSNAVNILDIVQQALHALSLSSEIASIISKCLKSFLPKIMDTDPNLFVDIMDSVWHTIFERRKTDFFWISIKDFMETIFQPELMSHSESHLIHKISDEAYRLCDTAPNIFCLLVFQCYRVWSETNNCGLEKHLPILLNASIFGPVHRKDQKVIDDASLYISSLGEDCSANIIIDRSYLDDSTVRILAVGLILKLEPGNAHDQRIAHQLLSLLLEKEKEVTCQRVRYFENSFIHRIKNRIWQIIMLLEIICSDDIKASLIETVYTELMKEGAQPSVRLYQEWLAVRILKKYPNLRTEFWANMNKAASVRVGSVGSFLTITTHLAKVLTGKNQEDFILTALPRVFPWCMAQNFNVRIAAQVSFHLLWQISKKLDMKSVLKMSETFEECLNFTLGNGNASKNTKKLLGDFYYNAFHCIQHYSLETIFYVFPRLSGLTSDEWILPASFTKMIPALKEGMLNSFVPLYNQDGQLSCFETSSWLTKNRLCSDLENRDEIAISSGNVQKKWMPWKNVLLDDRRLLLEDSEKGASGGLIVVSSIIERIPNLGGLCRTCEIFGASEYVIGNLKFLEDKQFQNLSVSSERWIPIKEVKRHQLKNYLCLMQNKGYTLVGAEQTTNSCQLHEYRFPKKTLLLLGNEKEGIPVELIQLLDICLEIPQKGVVRSLNVHVSGAVIIWEYARQHLFGASK